MKGDKRITGRWLPANVHPQEAWNNTWIPCSKSHLNLPHLHCTISFSVPPCQQCYAGYKLCSRCDIPSPALLFLAGTSAWGPPKETSQGWNCAKTRKGCLLPYYFYSIWFLATIACFWEWTKWQSRTSLLILFSSEELRRAVPHATSCLLVLFCKEVRGIVCICCCALFFMGEQEDLLALMLLYFSYSHSTHIQGEGYENVWEGKHY